jgi:hypothetical protein
MPKSALNGHKVINFLQSTLCGYSELVSGDARQKKLNQMDNLILRKQKESRSPSAKKKGGMRYGCVKKLTNLSLFAHIWSVLISNLYEPYIIMRGQKWSKL